MPPPPGLREALADRYAFDRELGSGATATVFLATDLKHQRKVAIKVLRPELAASMAAERFLREISIAAQLQHPHILSLLDSGSAAGSLYFVMPFLDGETLRARLEHQGRLTVAEAIRVLSDVADALVHAHGHGVIHRDIKPDNVMITGRHAVVMDFGVSKAVNAAVDRHLTSGIAIGTPTYMAPEQAMADPRLDHRVDLYALGVMGYEILAGKPPLGGASPREVLTAHVVITPESVATLRPEIPFQLANLVMRCLAKRPEDRWQTAAEIVAQLDPLATPGERTTPTGSVPSSSPARWLPWLAGAIGLIGVGMAVWAMAVRSTTAPAPTTRIEQVTFLGTVLEGRYSPDGQFIAFVTGDSAGQRLWLQDETASRPIEIVSAPSIEGVSWLESGTEISYTITSPEGTRVERIPRLGGTRKAVGQGRALLSPDGRRLLWASPASKTIIVADVVSGDTIRLARSGDYDWIAGVDWSPSSDRVLLALSDGTSRSAITAITLDGRETFLVRDSSAVVLAPRFSLDGRAIQFLRDDGLYQLGLDQRGQPDGPPSMLRGGLSIGYDESRSPFLGSLSVGPRGKSLVVQQQHRANLARVTLGDRGAGGIPVTITRGTTWYREAKLSPRGDRIAASKRQTNGGVMVGTLPIEGGDFVELGRFEDGYELAWSPGGHLLAFVAGNPVLGLEVIDVDGGPSRRLASGQIGARVSWLGKAVLTTGPRNGGLMVTDLQSGRTQPVSSVDTTVTVGQPRASPDGRWVAFHARITGVAGLWVTAPAETGQRMLASGLWEPVGWRAGSDSVFAAPAGPRVPRNELVLLPRAGGSPRIVLSLPPEFRFEDVSPDGRSVLLSRFEGFSDLWVVTGERR